MKCKDYIKPNSLAELKTVLKTINDNVVYLAGGTDLFVQTREDDRCKDSVVIDIFGLKELREIKDVGDRLLIGSGCTHTQICNSPLIEKCADILKKACETVGSVLIRNHATIGGNVCNASPAADSLSSLSVLDARAIILHNGEEVEKSLTDLILKPGKNSLENKGLLLYLSVKKLKAGTKTGFYKVGRRKALAISRMTISVIIHKDKEELVDDFSISIGATFPRPMTFADVNNILIGKKLSAELIDEVSTKISDKIPEIAGIRKSTTYKQPVCKRLVSKILTSFMN